MSQFGKKLRALRQERGLGVRELARELGYGSHAHVNLIELGKAEPSLDMARRVARYFGVSIDWLVEEAEES